MTNIVIGMETLQTILAGCIEAEMTEDGLLSDVQTFKRIYLEEEHIDEPFIWMYQHETRPNRQADISRTMELTTPFQFNCAVYEPEMRRAPGRKTGRPVCCILLFLYTSAALLNWVSYSSW